MKKGAAGTKAGKKPEPGKNTEPEMKIKPEKKPPVIRRMVIKTGKSIMTIKRKRNITNSFFSAALSKIMDIWEKIIQAAAQDKRRRPGFWLC